MDGFKYSFERYTTTGTSIFTYSTASSNKLFTETFYIGSTSASHIYSTTVTAGGFSVTDDTLSTTGVKTIILFYE